LSASCRVFNHPHNKSYLEIFAIDVPLQDKEGKTELPHKEFWRIGFNLAIGDPFKAFCKTIASSALFQLPYKFEKSNELFLETLKENKLEKPGEAYAFLILDAYRQGLQTALTRISKEPLDKSRLNDCDWTEFNEELEKLSSIAEDSSFSEAIESSPRNYPPIPELGKLLATQIEKFGLEKTKTKAFISASENLFLSNLFGIISKNSNRYRSFLKICKSNNSAREVEKDFDSYLKSLISYKTPIANLTKEAYIPPLAEYWPNPGTGMTKETWSEPCFVEDAQNCLDEWLKNEDSSPFFLVSGDPGSGKSVMLKKWAATLASPNNPFGSHLPIIVPASKILSGDNPATAILESLQSQGFFQKEKTELFPPNRKTVLILEFLEDLWLNSESSSSFDLFTKKITQLIDEDKNGNLKIAISSHSIPAQWCAEALRNKVTCLSLLPLKFEVSQTRASAAKFLIFDNRIKWQNALKKQLEGGANEIISKLDSSFFEDISRNPWINQTMMEIALNEGINKNKPNDIYEKIFSRLLNLFKKLFKRPWPLREKDYFRLMEEIAVACSAHGGAATLDQIRDRIHSAGRKESLESLVNIFSCSDPLLGLMTTGFFKSKWSSNGERVFSLSFPSLQKYLLARCLSDTAWQMRVQTKRHEDSEGDQGWNMKQALLKWIKLTGPIHLDKKTVGLLKGEEKRFLHDPDAMKTLQVQFGLFLSEAVKNNLPIREALTELKLETNPENLDKFFSNTTITLFAFCAYCGNSAQKPTEVKWGNPKGFISLLKQIVLNENQSAKIVFKFLHNLNFDRQDLREENEKDKLDFTGANFSKSSFKHSNLEETDFPEADFSGADFSMANLGKGNFTGADLQGAEFSTATLTRANFYEAIIDKNNYEIALKKDARVRGAIAVRLNSKHQNSHQTPFKLGDRKNRSAYYNAKETFYD
jgi:hypothetical protein